MSNASEYCGSSTASDPTVGSAANFHYLGCFTDNDPGPLYLSIDTPNTSDCATYCGELGYPFMGRMGFDTNTQKATCGCGTEV